MNVEEVLRTAIAYVVPVVEACGALVILLEVVRTAVRSVINFFKPQPGRQQSLRIRLGQSMVMGLEFQVAADILKTALSPTWNDILFLAALVGLRTAMNYLLERELRWLNEDENR